MDNNAYTELFRTRLNKDGGIDEFVRICSDLVRVDGFYLSKKDIVDYLNKYCDFVEKYLDIPLNY